VDFVFIHREAFPVGPPVFELVISKMLNKKIIYDFDDAIWLTDKPIESYFIKLMKFRSKVGMICRNSYKVSCGNAYLKEFALRFNPKSILNPTTVDTTHLYNTDLYNASRDRKSVTIGWTGSHSTLKYLAPFLSVFYRLRKKHEHLWLMIIADENPFPSAEGVIYRQWNKATEINDLLQADIGIMPMPDDQWTSGKCGFKLLQYLSLSIPAVASPVSVNTNIIQQGINGYLCNSDDEWYKSLEKLIVNEELRVKLGNSGRQWVIDHYSVTSNASNFLSLFE
jgi:glycosyltransferase involved in cell wall biosynthesis